MGKWIIVLCITFSACSGTKNISTFSPNDKHIDFEKTKIKLNSKTFGNITLKGYIYLVKDSLICFKFYGPFSYEVISGLYIDTFKIFDHFNKVKYANVENTIFSQAGVTINRQTLQFLLLGNVGEMKTELLKLNKSIFRIESNISSKKCELLIFIDSEQKFLKFKFLLVNQIPKSVLISYKDPLTNWSANIQNVNITNHSKKCNFGF